LGAKSRRLKLFLEQHPICCFCGGDVAAVSIDHVPNSAVFHKRDRPEGYAFPACDQCQTVSRKSELVFAALARSSYGLTEEENRETIKLYEAFARRDREGFDEFLGPERTSKLLLPNSVRARLHMPDGGAIMNIGPQLGQHLDAYIEKLL
jgi:hypothetical protein